MEPFVNNFQVFLLILTRILGLLTVAPIFSADSIPFAVRMMFSFLFSIILFPFASGYMPPVPGSMGTYALLVASEIFIGILIGFLVNIIFASFQMAGEFFSVQIGFGYTEVLDPVSQTSNPVISTLKNLMAIVIFLITGGHRILFESLAFSFEKIQMIRFTSEVNSGILKTFEYTFGAMFLVAFKIALPVLGILFLITIAEALMGKAASQMNIMYLSFPVKLVVGIFVLIAIMPFIEKQMVHGFEITFDRINNLLSEWPDK
ncbi:MAG: flagellar biosynthetic protein FliR [Leptospiraceae bacterium]|nr:flagellar biosynthetic protein FliR [Leptospiraceae bacterium]MCK6380401.1 flagellar biosynthetic protein FliR [Leptospiraceae bacterium]NUM42490.1 flagellar biosynthetic protein FliR [Leptospiraceae bacterium]